MCKQTNFERTRQHIVESQRKTMQTNSRLRNAYLASDLLLISIVGKQCKLNVCLTRVPLDDALNLLVTDQGHRTEAGSNFVAKEALEEHLHPMPCGTTTGTKIFDQSYVGR